MDNPDLTVDELMQYIPGPDFPTAGIISSRAGIIEGQPHQSRASASVPRRRRGDGEGRRSPTDHHHRCRTS